jgi:hypothetical protein
LKKKKKQTNKQHYRNKKLEFWNEPARSKSLHQIEVKAPYTTTTIIIMSKLQQRPHSHFSLSLSLSLSSANSNAINKEFKTQASKSGEN